MEKGVCNNEKIILVEKEEVLRKDSKISDTFNNYFVNITDELGIYNQGNIPEFVSADKILRYINEIDIKKSSSGEISPAIIKLAKK